jgi:hypothetical protein
MQPDLVKRAEQAAEAVEQAWMRWRARHGLGSGPLSPVSSYVGYSVEEPWGQPRVVLGIAADEAERLAAILDADDYVGPVHATLTGWSDRYQLPESATAAAPGDLLSVPAQSSGRESAEHKTADREIAGGEIAGGEIAGRETAGGGAAEGEAAERETAGRGNAGRGSAGRGAQGRDVDWLDAGAPTVALPIGATTLTAPSCAGAADNARAVTEPSPADLTLPVSPHAPATVPGQPAAPAVLDEPESASAAGTQAQLARPETDQDTVITDLRELVARTTGRPPMSQAFPATAHAGNEPQPKTPSGPVAVQGSPAAADQGSAQPETAPVGAAEPGVQAAAEPVAPHGAVDSAGAPQHADDMVPHNLPAGSRLVSVTSKNRPRKPAPGHDGAPPWPVAQGKRHASDTAV